MEKYFLTQAGPGEQRINVGYEVVVPHVVGMACQEPPRCNAVPVKSQCKPPGATSPKPSHSTSRLST